MISTHFWLTSCNGSQFMLLLNIADVQTFIPGQTERARTLSFARFFSVKYHLLDSLYAWQLCPKDVSVVLN